MTSTTHITVSPRTLVRLAEILAGRSTVFRIEGAAERYAAEAAEAGGVSRYDVDDMLFKIGMPCELRGFVDDFGLMPEPLFMRPRGNRDMAHPSDRIPAGTFAAAAVLLERLGLDVDPKPVVDAIRPLLLKKELVTRPELRVLWFARERHRSVPVRLVASRAAVATGTPTRLPTGYTATPMLDAAGAIVSIEITAPRYRVARKPATSTARRVANRDPRQVEPHARRDIGEAERGRRRA